MAIVNKLSAESLDHSVASTLLTQTIHQFRAHPGFSIRHASRAANRVVQSLALWSLDSTAVILLYFPSIFLIVLHKLFLDYAIFG
ncbi:hypothetical protein V6N13_094415 [Hibiscus sabdariffa]